MPDPSFYLENAKKRFEEGIANDPECSFNALVIVRKDDEDALMLFGAQPRFLAKIALVGVSGFEADEIVFIADSFYASQETNPEGKKWSHGEMQERSHEPAERA